MKNKKILLIIVSIIALIFCLNVKCYAAENTVDNTVDDTNALADTKEDTEKWPDFTNAKVEFEPTSKEYNNDLKVKISNVNFDSSNFEYSCEISNGSVTYKNIGQVNGQTMYLNGNLGAIDNVYAKAGDINVTVTAKNKNTLKEKEVLSSKKIERLSQLALGNRIKTTITSNHISMSINEAIGANRTIKTKIGVVTDENLLKSIGKNESGWRAKLLEYAKKNQAINTGTINNVSNNVAGGDVATGLNLVDKAYYFLYIEVDDENGTYYPVEDIYFTQASKTSDGESWLTTDWKMENLVEEEPQQTPTTNVKPETSSEEKENDNTVAKTNLPKTGEGIAIFVAILTIITISIIAKIKYNKYKEI